MHANTTIPRRIIGATLKAPSNKGECFEKDGGLVSCRPDAKSRAGITAVESQAFVCHMSTPGGRILPLVNPGRRSEEEEEERCCHCGVAQFVARVAPLELNVTQWRKGGGGWRAVHVWDDGDGVGRT